MNASLKSGALPPLVAQILADSNTILVDGKWGPAQSGATLDVIDPSTGKVIAQSAAGGVAEVDAAVRAARTAFDSGPWSKMLPKERRRLLLKLADAIEAETTELALIDSLNMGMPVFAARVICVDLSVESLRYNAGWTDKVSGETLAVSAPDHHAYTLKEPVGVVGAIVPWNSPLVAAVSKLAPALAAGCTVVLKPAELTPLSAVRLGQLIEKAGFPPGVVNIVTGLGDPAGRALVEHPLVDKITFTGSTAVGKSIVRGVADTMKRVSLELGGKSPVFVFADADLDAAIEGAAAGIFRNAGQVCAAGSRLYVHKSVFDRVVGAVAERARNMKIGPAQQPGVQMGPIVSQKQLERVAGYIDSGRQEGAEVLAGGQRVAGDGYFLQPTVLAQTNNTMRVVREEIFGPVLCASPVTDDDLEQIANVGNDSNYGLSAYIWTRNISVAHKLARKLRTGSIRINGGVPLDRAVPFGGYKQSGWGREYGKEGVEAFLETKAVTVAL